MSDLTLRFRSGFPTANLFDRPRLVTRKVVYECPDSSGMGSNDLPFHLMSSALSKPDRGLFEQRESPQRRLVQTKYCEFSETSTREKPFPSGRMRSKSFNVKTPTNRNLFIP